MRALLDVNVLIALLDTAHSHHTLASRWFAQNLSNAWATCPLTVNGCIRIMSAPAYPGDFSVAEVAARLAQAVRHPAHIFWPADIDSLDARSIVWSHLLGHRQITDAYLLALAVRHGGRLVTFDRRISPNTVGGADARHCLALADLQNKTKGQSCVV